MAAIKKQIPGQLWVFRNKITGEELSVILPSKYGENTSLLSWNKSKNRKKSSKEGGSWKLRQFGLESVTRRQSGAGVNGLLGRMKYILPRIIRQSKEGGYEPPLATPEQMTKQWLAQKGICLICGGAIKLFGSRKDPGASYDHNHETGEGRGFIHNHCNVIEGYSLRLSNEEFEKLFEFLRKLRKMNKSSESYKVYLDKTEAAKSGVTSQPEIGGQSYPGRALPPVQEVTTAKDNPGTTVRCAKEQTGENRYPINSHAEKNHLHGPNN